MIDLEECEKLIKGKYEIDDETPLLFLKFEKLTSIASEKNVQYEVYEPFSKELIDLSICDNTSIDLYIPISLSKETQDLYNNLKQSGYDLFNLNDSFYNDICTPFESENGTDVLLSDRKNDYYNNNDTTCQNICQFTEYSSETKYLKCECNVELKEIDIQEPEKFSGKFIITSFYSVLKYSNFQVLKCFKLVFSFTGIYKNYGNIMVIIYFLLYIPCFILYIIKGIKPIKIDAVSIFLEKPRDNQDNNIGTNSNKNFKNKGKSLFNKSNKQNKNKDKKYLTELNKNRLEKNNKININNKIKKSQKKNLKDLLNNKINKDNKNNIIRTNIIFKYPNNKLKKDYEESKKIDNTSLNNKNQTISSKRNMRDLSGKLKMNNKFRDSQIEQILDEKTKSTKIKIDEKSDDFELNELDYYEALKLDKRPFHKIYWATLKREHSILFTFFNWKDYNLPYIKLARFFFLLCTDMALNVFFFSDDSMHKIYLNYGKYDFIQQIPQIIYSTIVSQLLEVFICFLSLTDKHIYEIKGLKINTANKMAVLKIIKCINIKLSVFFVITFAFFIFYWYIITAFCAVYKNTQIIFINDSLNSFAISLFTPFIIYLIPVCLRVISLKDQDKKRLKFIYKLSDIIPFF